MLHCDAEMPNKCQTQRSREHHRFGGPRGSTPTLTGGTPTAASPIHAPGTRQHPGGAQEVTAETAPDAAGPRPTHVRGGSGCSPRCGRDCRRVPPPGERGRAGKCRLGCLYFRRGAAGSAPARAHRQPIVGAPSARREQVRRLRASMAALSAGTAGRGLQHTGAGDQRDAAGGWWFAGGCWAMNGASPPRQLDRLPQDFAVASRFLRASPAGTPPLHRR